MDAVVHLSWLGRTFLLSSFLQTLALFQSFSALSFNDDLLQLGGNGFADDVGELEVHIDVLVVMLKRIVFGAQEVALLQICESLLHAQEKTLFFNLNYSRQLRVFGHFVEV